MAVQEPGSIGIVEVQYFTFAAPPNELQLECGLTFGPIALAYEMYGEMNADKSNCILVCHALSGDSHAAGRYSADDAKPGWWDSMIGPGKAFDTDKYCIICSNVIGGCKGSTGPGSINLATGEAFALDFPMVTISDMVQAQKALIDYLEIKQLLCVVGGSMGGMQVLQWSVSYPDMIRLAIPICTTARLSAQTIGFNAVGRHAIMADPNWDNGNYYGKETPSRGLGIARMVAHITYLSEKSMHKKFGRDLQDKSSLDYDFVTEFKVESYLNYNGDEFVKRFDANSYLYITKAMDYFDLAQPTGELRRSLSVAKAAFLVISVSSDWLFPPFMSKEIVSALRRNNLDVSYAELQSDYGHDAFLLEVEVMTRLITSFLEYGQPVEDLNNKVFVAQG